MMRAPLSLSSELSESGKAVQLVKLTKPAQFQSLSLYSFALVLVVVGKWFLGFTQECCIVDFQAHECVMPR